MFSLGYTSEPTYQHYYHSTMENNKLNNTITHSCSDNHCNGAGLKGLHVKCSKCGSKMFLECLKSRSATSELLKTYGIITSQFDVVIDSITAVQKSFNIIFDHNSPFAIYCAFCRLSTEPSMRETINKMEANVTAKQIKIDKLEAQLTEQKSKASEVMNNSKTDTIDSDSSNANTTSKKKVESTVQQIAPPKQGEDGLFSLYVSIADTKATEDSIVSYIVEKIDISTDVFKVIKLHSRRKYRKTYTAFKLIAFTEEVSKLFCVPSVWSDDFRVRAFGKARKRDHRSQKFVEKRNVNNRRSTKSTQRYTKNSTNTNNNVHSYRNTTRQHLRDGNNMKKTNRFNNKHQQNRSNFNKTQYNRKWSQNDHNDSSYQLQNGQMPQIRLPQMNLPAPFWYQMPYFYPPPQQQIHFKQGSPPSHHFQTPPNLYQPFNVQHQQSQPYTMPQPM